MAAKKTIVSGPPIHPSCAMLHAKDNTPDPITPVTMCATAVHTVPALTHSPSIPQNNNKNLVFMQSIINHSKYHCSNDYCKS